MDGMLSQDEINALLSGMDLTDSGSVTEPATDPEKEILSDMIFIIEVVCFENKKTNQFIKTLLF